MKKNLPFILLGFAIVLFAVVPSVYFYGKYREVNRKLVVGEKDDVDALVKKISKHVLLPSGETPTVMTVTDTEKLSGQQFFSHAKNGDKVLVYTGAKKAFLYDVTGDRVLEIGPVINASDSAMIAPGQTTPTVTPQPTPRSVSAPFQFLLLNGTTTAGLTKTFEQELLNEFPQAKVVDRDNAKKTTYTASLLIDMTGKKKDEAEVIAEKMNLEISELPSVEATSGGTYEFMVILGKDRE